ncbi:hypothetical protein HHK36_028032 [Tetracentron sinense]|uniref:DUF7745 domain-containing protein n=1 Tax=Tetracentron sinense TaxID=13715 RepID=A0A835D231_TETSI|nr:hypothetical protein HHK36_028032 [Tetracentron sinense]
MPIARVDDFVRGESSNKDCPARFHVEARRRRPPEMPYKPKVDGILEYILYWCSFGPDDHRKGGFYSIHSILVFNSDNKAISVAWIITPRFANVDEHKWIMALYNRVHTKDPACKLAGFIAYDPSTDVLTISCPKALKLRSKALSTHLDTMEPSVRRTDDSAFAFQTLPNVENHRLCDKKLKRWLDSLDSSEQEAFKKLKLGTVASLFNVKIKGHLVEAALGCWSLEFHVFKLGVFELSPTLEEYGRLMSVPFDQDRIVIPFCRASWKSKAASLLEVKRGFLEKLDGEENYYRCSLKFLVDNFFPRNPSWISTSSFIGLPGSWLQYRFRALALAVVGHVLFPLSFNFIDMKVVEVVEQIINGHSFIPMLLAETFRALDRCVQKRGGFFRGCISLLQVWLLEHLKFSNLLTTPAFMRQDLIESHYAFSEISLYLDSPETWYDQLVLLVPNMLVWKCSWLHVLEILSDIPIIEAIKDVVEFGSSSEELISRLFVGWKSRVRNTFGDDQDSFATIEKEPMNVLLIEDQPSYKELEEKVTSLLVENEDLKAEVTKLGSEAAVYRDRIKDLKTQVDTLETVNEEFQYFQNPINGRNSNSHEVILKLNAEQARLRQKLKDQGEASSDSD